MGANPTGYAVLRLLLRKFPDREHLCALNEDGSTPLHFAAYHANHAALDIIADHAAGVGITLDINVINYKGHTPLSYCGAILKVIRIEENNEHVSDALKLRMAKTYQCMRNRGACLPFELEPIMVAYVCPGLSRFVHFSDALYSAFARTQQELTIDVLISFLRARKREMGLDWELLEGKTKMSLETPHAPHKPSIPDSDNLVLRRHRSCCAGNRGCAFSY